MVTISVCIGSACHLKGSYNVISELQQLIEQHGLSQAVEIKGIFCLGHCSGAVSVKINDGEVESVTPKTVDTFFQNRILPLASA